VCQVLAGQFIVAREGSVVLCQQRLEGDERSGSENSLPTYMKSMQHLGS